MEKRRDTAKRERITIRDVTQEAAYGSGRLEHWTEQIIREAAERGDFDDLPGKGRPLHLRDPDPYGGPEAEVYRYLKEAGFTPQWVEMRTQITNEIKWLRQNPDHPDRMRRLTELNSLIKLHNRLVPTQTLTFPLVPNDSRGQTP